MKVPELREVIERVKGKEFLYMPPVEDRELERPLEMKKQQQLRKLTERDGEQDAQESEPQIREDNQISSLPPNTETLQSQELPVIISNEIRP